VGTRNRKAKPTHVRPLYAIIARGWKNEKLLTSIPLFMDPAHAILERHERPIYPFTTASLRPETIDARNSPKPKEAISMKLKTILVSAAFIFLIGCRAQSGVQLTETAQVTQIAGAETLIATLSQTPDMTETPTPTIAPSATSTPSTTATPTQNSIFTLTPTQSSTTTGEENSSTCDRARFVDDITIPDGTEMEPGESFTKTWRLENTGTCPWTTNYSVQFLNGTELGGETVPISGTVAPGETIDLSINFIAPAGSGIYVSEWAIVNESGAAIEESFYVQIEVTNN